MTAGSDAPDVPDTAGDASRALRATGARCPHCGGLTRIEPHERFRWVCSACGGPRLPALDKETVEAPTAIDDLRRADGARKHAFAARLGATVLGACGTLVALLGAALAAASVTVTMVLLAVAIGAFIPAVALARRARRLSNEALRGVFVAWESAAEAVVRAEARAGTTVSGAELARRLGTTEADVERMMTLLTVDDRVRIDVKDAEILYAPASPEKLAEERGTDDGEEAARADQRRG